MKQRYTITIAGVEMNVLSDESPEAVEALVGIVDRKMKEISTGSKYCSKNEAAILCALDYCSEKIKALETKLAYTETALDELQAENDELRKELAEAQNK